ncbi:MAG: hypothetical protein K2M08_05765 [Anaeroplasmataceae bacterium]|nr:hypothetical protein [Anaeroplasmataceae bacterium]
MEKIICSNKEDWARIMDSFRDNNASYEFEVIIDDRHQLSNLIYFYPLFLRNNNIRMHISVADNLDSEENDIFYEVSALMFLSSHLKKEMSNLVANVYSLKTKQKYSERSKVVFKTTLPFLFFDLENLQKLNDIDEEFILDLDKLILTCNYQDLNEFSPSFVVSYEFVKMYIKKSIQDLQTRKKENIINSIIESGHDLNMLALFLYVFFIMSEEESLDDNDIVNLTDLKYTIRNLAIGIHQILENSCKHSCGKIAYFSLSYLNFERKKRFLPSTNYEESVSNLQKEISFLNNYDFNTYEKKYLFIRMIDDARLNEPGKNTSEGIREKEGRKDSLREYFELIWDPTIQNQEQEDMFLDSSDYIPSPVSTKYGLQVFLRASKKLNMQCRVNSLESNFITGYYKKSLFYDSNKSVNQHVTEYSCVMPLYSSSIGRTNIENGLCYANKIELINDLEDRKIRNISFDTLYYEAGGSKEDKEGIVKYITEKLFNTKLNNNLREELCSFDILEIDISNNIKDSEILVKCLANYMYVFAKMQLQCLVSLNFIDDTKDFSLYRISDFFQFLLILSTRVQGLLKERNIKIKNNDFQIAIYHSIEGNKRLISTIVGIDWNIIISSFINNLLYSNEFSNKDYFKLYIDYLNLENSVAKNNDIMVFPYELYDNGKITRNSAFVTKLDSALKQNYVMHKNVNVLLKSGLYLNTFYEAEHIFLNHYIVSRLALLIFKDLIKSDDYKKNQKILIAGYADYSHQLCEAIKTIIEQQGKECEIIYLSGSKNLTYNEKEEYDKKKCYVSILPIGSTLNTFLKMNAVLKNRYKNTSALSKYIFNVNYAIVSVAPRDENNEFWETIRNNGIFYEIRFKTNHAELGGITIKNLIKLDTEWSKDNYGNAALTHVNESSTLPDTIHTIKPKKQKDLTENFTKFRYLKNSVKYGHFSLDNSHYSFYIDHHNILESNKDCLKDVETQLGLVKIDPLAYNIIVSPLNQTNNLFLDAVVQEVFKNNVSIIQFDPFNTFRDNFIQKYNYILKTIDRIANSSSNTQINIYFVDNTIITGKTFSRAKELVYALLKNTKYIHNKDFSPRIFEKAFIFINRCSTNTLEVLMQSKKNLFMYLDICCPHFDTNANVCPDCKISKNYQSLINLSSSGDLIFAWTSKMNKHKLISIDRNQKLIYTLDDFIRLCFTHLVLKDIEGLSSFDMTKSDELCYEFVDGKFQDYASKVKELYTLENDNQDEKFLRQCFIKVFSRPLVTKYEQIKQISWRFIRAELLKELNDKTSKEKNCDYIIFLIERLSYYGSDSLKKECNKIKEFKKDLSKQQQIKIDAAFEWEWAYSKGIIR